MTRFRIQTTLRTLILTASIWSLVLLAPNPDYRITSCILFLLILAQMIDLIRFVESTQKHVAQFLEAIRQSDFSQLPNSSHMGSSFDELKHAYEGVLEVFRNNRAQTEEKARYLEMVLQHARVGLIGFRQDGNIEIQNHTAKKLLQCNQLRNLSDLRKRNPKLAEAIEQSELRPNTILKLNMKGSYRQLVVNLSTLQFKNNVHTLVSIYDIQNELDEKEMEAWQTLIRVLTHEIMNSVTPISSLAETTLDIVKNELTKESSLPPRPLYQVESAISTIHKRSQNLLEFVENYRKLTRIPLPDFQHIPVADMLHRIEQLMQSEFSDNHVHFSWKLHPDTLTIMGDRSLIEQVCINLITNAIQATRDVQEPHIEIRGFCSEIGRTLLEFKDNGVGMDEEVLEKIFIPFFTTKSKGSGIGLSLSRQIMRLHGGSIHVTSALEKGTRFSLQF